MTVRGDYPATGFILRLGDLQRSAMNIIDIAQQTTDFAELAELQGVSGVAVGPYSDQFADLADYQDADRGDVITTQLPTVLLQPRSSVSVRNGSWLVLASVARSTPRADVQWQVSTDGGTSWTDIRNARYELYLHRVNRSDDRNLYRAEFTNEAGTTYSSATTLRVR